MPNKGRSIGGTAYNSHVKGKIFLTEKGGIPYWISKSSDFAEHNFDNIYEDQLVPVVLRASVNDIEGIENDALGTKDSNIDAWMSVNGIPAEIIEIWNGNSWVDISNYESLNIEDALYSEGDGEDKLWYFKKDSPFIPK